MLRGMTNGYSRWWGDAIRRKVKITLRQDKEGGVGVR